ncbi:MAG: TolC family protein [Syntrophaceae bacterium]|nr:TolC family protein [Syntrophaceae bacterium]
MRAKNYCLIFSAILLFFLAFIQSAIAAEKLTLPQSIDLALKQSVLIQSAREGVRGAEAQKQEAFTNFLPKFSTSYSYTRQNEQPTATMTFPSLTPSRPVTVPVGTQDNYTWAVEVKQPLFAGGGIVANYRANRIGAEIAAADETTVVQDIVQEVKIAYFNVLKAERLHSVAVQAVEQLEAHRKMAQDFFDVGIIPRNDLLRAEVELANGRHNLVKAENSVEMAKSKFNTVLRREINTPTTLEDILTLKPFTQSLNECQKHALENRSEIKSSAMKVEHSQKMVDMTKSEYFPTINAVGHYERFGDTPGVSGSLYKDQEYWYVMGVASWNFWEWGRTKNRVDASRSRENQTAYALQNIKDQVTLEVKNAWLGLHEAEKQLAVTQKAIEQAEENYRISRERYQEQVGTSTDVLDAQTLLTRAKVEYFNALSDYNISMARLERAMGAREVSP